MAYMMFKLPLNSALALTAVFALAACSSSDDDKKAGATTEPTTEQTPSDGAGKPGGDVKLIAGLWDGTIKTGEIDDVVYWNLSEDGVLTRYDYQQDGVEGATTANCYIVGDPITFAPEGGDAYSIASVAVTAVRTDDVLTITFTEPDKNDLNGNGDSTETPTLTWSLLSSIALEALLPCTSTEKPIVIDVDGTEPTGIPGDNDPDKPTTEVPDVPGIPGDTNGDKPTEIPGDTGDQKPLDPVNAERPTLTREECTSQGGTIVGDIGDGAIHRPEYRCESGMPPIGTIKALEGEPISIEGEVCCL